VVDHEGRRYRVVGDQIGAGGTEISFTGEKTGRRVEPTKPPPSQPLELGSDGWVVGD
jgi:hypothetical protein